MKLRAGDIILQDASFFKREIGFWERQLYKVQRKLDSGPATHVMIYVGDGSILEMSYNGLNNRHRLYDGKGYMDDGFRIIRHIKGIKPILFRQVVQEWLDSHKNNGYSYRGWMNAALSLVTLRLFGRRLKLFKEERSAFCSEFIGELYKLYGLPFNIDDDILTPNDILRSKQFKIIKYFQKEPHKFRVCYS